MSLLALAQQELPELLVLEDGEYQVQISSAKEKEFSSGRTGWSIGLTIPDQPDADTIFDNVFNVKEGDSPKTERMMVQGAQEFAAAFDIESDDVESWAGLTAWAKIEVETYEGKDRNRVARYLPHRQ